MYANQYLSGEQSRRGSSVRKVARALSSLLLALSICGAFAALFALPANHYPVIAVFLIGCFFSREILLAVGYSPPHSSLGSGFSGYAFRLLLLLFRWALRAALALFIGLLLFGALAGVGSAASGALAASVVGTFVAMTVLQELEWGRILISRGHQVGLRQSGNVGGPGVIVVTEHTHEVYQEIRYVEKNHEH